MQSSFVPPAQVIARRGGRGPKLVRSLGLLVASTLFGCAVDIACAPGSEVCGAVDGGAQRDAEGADGGAIEGPDGPDAATAADGGDHRTPPGEVDGATPTPPDGSVSPGPGPSNGDASIPPPPAPDGMCLRDADCLARGASAPYCEQGRCVECRSASDCGGRACNANTCGCDDGFPPVNGRCCGNGHVDQGEQCELGQGDGRALWTEATCDRASCKRIFWQPCGPVAGLHCPARSRCNLKTGTCSPTTCPSDDPGCITKGTTSPATSAYVTSMFAGTVHFPEGCPQQPFNTGLSPVGSESLWCWMSCIRSPCPAPLRCNSDQTCVGPEATER